MDLRFNNIISASTLDELLRYVAWSARLHRRIKVLHRGHRHDGTSRWQSHRRVGVLSASSIVAGACMGSWHIWTQFGSCAKNLNSSTWQHSLHHLLHNKYDDYMTEHDMNKRFPRD